MAKTRKPRLGRGLSSLMSTPVSVDPPPEAAAPAVPAAPEGSRSDVPPAARAMPKSQPHAAEAAAGQVGLVYIPLEQLEPNPHQPRQDFDAEAIASLAQSIGNQGLMQPLVVRPRKDVGGGYQIVAGERRWRAAREAGLDQVPAIVRELTDRQLAEWALVENLQREDLDPIERAEAFRGLVDRFGLTHDQIAQQVGVQRPTISNHLRLLDLQEEIQHAVRKGQLSGGHARALLGLSDPEARLALARRAIAGGWSVRMLESAVQRGVAGQSSAGSGQSPPQRPAHLADLEEQIAAQLQTKVRLKSGRKKGAGAITIEFYSLDEFDALLQRLGVNIK